MAGVFLACAVLLRVSARPPFLAEHAQLGLGILAFLGALVLLFPRQTAWLLVPAAAGLAWARAGPAPAAVPDAQLHTQARAVVVEARVRWARVEPLRGCSFQVDQLSGMPPGLRVWVRSTLLRAPAAGSRVRLQARARLVNQKLELDHAVWKLLPWERSPPSILQNARSWVRSRLQTRLPKIDAGLARALLLGESQAAPSFQRLAYRQLGLLHLLFISGLHFWVWSGLLRRLLPSRMAWLRWPVLFALAGLAQFSAPVLRAATALALREWLAARGRACLAWQLWACALWVEIARSAGLPMGLLLSYAATAGLLWVPPTPGRHWLLRSLVPSAAAFLATAPLVHTWQATLEAWSIPLTPVFACLLPFRLLGSALTCLPFGAWLGSGLFASTRFLEDRCLDLLAELPGTPWPLPHFSSLAVCLACAGCLLILRMRARLAGASLLAVMGCILLGSAESHGHLHATPIQLDCDPGNWVIATSQNGSWLIPLDNERLASRLRLGHGFLPLLAKSKARPP
jgi:hypothetical protein